MYRIGAAHTHGVMKVKDFLSIRSMEENYVPIWTLIIAHSVCVCNSVHLYIYIYIYIYIYTHSGQAYS